MRLFFYIFLQGLLQYMAIHSGYGKLLTIDNQWVIYDVVKAEVEYNKLIEIPFFI